MERERIVFKRDSVARLYGLAGAGLGLIALGAVIWEKLNPPIEPLAQQKIETLREELKQLQQEQKENLYADCVNENVIRGLVKAGVIDFDECTKEHAAWYKNYKGKK